VHERVAHRLGEFAAAVGINREVARRWCEAGKVPGAVKVGGTWRAQDRAAAEALEAAIG
jgi:predicted site-specific integrase-resolvase